MSVTHSQFEWPMWRCWLGDGRSVEFYFGRLGFALEVSEGHVYFAIPFFQAFIPYPGSKHYDDIDVNEEWRMGFSTSEDGVRMSWGRESMYPGQSRSAFFQWPWMNWHHVRHDILSEPETHPYHYCLESWEVQERTATIQVEEREWRLMFHWSPIHRVRRYIKVKFSDEVGERAGDWKGGTVGCGYDLRDGESPLQCLRRMERDRAF